MKTIKALKKLTTWYSLPLAEQGGAETAQGETPSIEGLGFASLVFLTRSPYWFELLKTAIGGRSIYPSLNHQQVCFNGIVINFSFLSSAKGICSPQIFLDIRQYRFETNEWYWARFIECGPKLMENWCPSTL